MPGWRRLINANAGVPALAVDVDGDVNPYIFGMGATDQGRIATSSLNGASITVADAYTFGEMIELRYTFAETGNSQRQGIFLQTRSDVANSSTVRGLEIESRQGAAVAIGHLSGAKIAANVASTTTGTVTTAEGMEVGVAFNSSAYTGTVTNFYGLRVKNQIEDGATITTGYSIYVETEAVSGAPTSTARLDAVIGVKTSPADGVGYWRYGIDTTGTEFTNGSGNEVVLWAFKGADGTTYYMVHDVDSPTAIGVVTSDPTT